MSLDDRLAERGEIGGRTVRITESGDVECHVYPLGPLPPGNGPRSDRALGRVRWMDATSGNAVDA